MSENLAADSCAMGRHMLLHDGDGYCVGMCAACGKGPFRYPIGSHAAPGASSDVQESHYWPDSDAVLRVAGATWNRRMEP